MDAGAEATAPSPAKFAGRASGRRGAPSAAGARKTDAPDSREVARQHRGATRRSRRAPRIDRKKELGYD